VGSLVPVPINYHRKDKLPTYSIEQLDHKEEEDPSEDEYQAFS